MSPESLTAALNKVRAFFVSQWKIITVIGLVLISVLGGAWSFIPAPSAEGSLKGHTVEIHRNAQISIIFDQKMDEKSVASAFTITPAITGAFSWEGQRLTFTPQTDFEKGLSYEVTIGEGARNIFRKKLKETYRQTFTVLDYPEAVVTAPVDGSVIMQDQRLTVLFDHPLRTLSRETKAPAIVKLEPAVDGEFLWLGTSGFEFVPDQGWPAATAIAATIPQGTKTADGGSTVADYTWNFATPNLAVSLSSSTINHNPTKPIRLSFNYPVAASQISLALSMKADDATIPLNQFTITVDPNDDHTVLISKKGGYTLGVHYSAELPAGFTAGLGSLGLRDAFYAGIQMDEKGFHLVSPQTGMKKCVSCSIELLFNNPVDMEKAMKMIKVSPAVGDISISSYESERVYIYGVWKPSTDYTVTIDPAFTDVYGQKISGATKLVVSTHPHEPRADFAGYSRFGVLAEHLPRVYQLRTLNLQQPVSVALCSGTFDQYVYGKDVDCRINASKNFETNGPLNDYKILDIDLDAIAGQALPLGVYTLNITIPELNKQNYYAPDPRRTLLIVNTALTMKVDADGTVLVWATDLKTGEPVSGVDVTLWDNYDEYHNTDSERQTRLIDTKQTDKDGLVLFNHVGQMLAVSVQDTSRFGFATSSWNDGISVWNYGLEQTYFGGDQPHIGYVYTDRRIYRPDQLMYFKGVVRFDADAKLSVPSEKNISVRITDSEGKDVYSETLPMTAFGTFHGEFQMQPSMALGGYTITANIAGSEIRGGFDVREYRRPDFRVDVGTPTGSVLSGDVVEIPVHAEYYHGIPLSKAKAFYQVSRRKLFFQPMRGEWYSFSNDDNMFDCWWYCRSESDYENVQSGDVVLDDHGDMVITLPANLTEYEFSAMYSVTVTVTDVNERSVSNNTEFPVHQGAYYLGIRSDYSSGWDSPNADFEVISLNHDESVRSNVSAIVTLYKRTWSNVKKEATDGSTFWDWQKTDTRIETKSVTTDGDGRAAVSFSPPESGEYVAVVEGRDSLGNAIAASVNRYVYRDTVAGVRVSDDHQMRIVQNKASYEVGETASLAVQTPYRSTKALLTIERDSIIEHRVITLGSANRLVEIPILEGYTPNVYVSVLAMQGGGEKDVPEFRMGYAQLQVNTTKKILDVSVMPDKTAYKPGDKVTLTIEAKRDGGKAADAEVSIAVVDERVIALLGSVDKNILGKFWFPRKIGVWTSQTLTMLVKKVFFATEGGAGGKGDEGVVPAIRGNFKDTAYWNATVETGSDGKATISFDLPDNITSWQILAIGTTKDTVVGNDETTIVTRRDLIVEPLFPRILRYNDTAVLGATVFNSTDTALTAKVEMKANGLKLNGAATHTVTVQPRSRESLYWPVTVPQSGSKADITVYANASGLEDGFTLPLLLFPYSVAESVTASGIFERNVTENVEIPSDVLKDVGNVNVSVQPNVGNSLQAGLDYLVEFPYGCSEQTTSDLLANLMFEQLATLKVTKSDEKTLDAAKANVNSAIQNLLAMQHYDGGFGFWPDSQRSYAHLTAYVYWGLVQAQNAGFSVDDAVLENAATFLRDSLSAGPYSDRYISDNEKAQVLFMLSERDPNGAAGYAATLFERRDTLPAYSKAFLAMAFANIDKSTTTPRTKQLMGELKNRLVYLNPSTAYIDEDEGYWWYMSTDVRTTSIYLQAMLRLEAGNEDIERVVRYLVEHRKEGYWQTTQNTAMALIGLVEYVRANPIDERLASVEVFLNNKPAAVLEFPQGDVSGQASKQFPLPELLSKGREHQIGLEKDSDKRWFYDVTMTMYRAIEDIEPFENGFTVISDMYALDDKKNQQPLDQVDLGETVRVRLKLLVPKNHQYVALEHHLPAGLEAIDFSLKTSPKNLAGEQQQCAPGWDGQPVCFSPDSYAWDWWWENVWQHIEFRDDRVFLFAETLQPGVYEYEFLVKAVTPGTFRVPPARAYEFYNPLSNAHNEGKLFTVRSK